MLRTLHFWEDEYDAPLLERNYSFVQAGNCDSLSNRVQGWLEILEVDESAFDWEELKMGVVSEENLRVFRRDAERTYVPKDDAEIERRTKERQDKHVDTLSLIVGEVQDYHQGLGYIVAFLGLFLESKEVAKIALTLHRDAKYSAGYFMGAPQNFVADAKVFYKILEKKNPRIHEHLSSKGVLPEMFVVKWFVGLCLHVLPFSALFDFYENYFTHGSEYLFKFALKYIETFESELMAAHTTHSQMTILRAEDEKADWKLPQELVERHERENIFETIVNEALLVDLDCDLDQMRAVERESVSRAVEAAKIRDQELKDMYSDDEIVFSDEE